jgi:HlyD family secretion protein
VKRPWIIALALVAVSGIAFVAVRERGVAVGTVVVTRRDLDHRVVAIGRVLSPSKVNVSATTSGLVVAVGAALGQHVKTGDLLVQIDDAEARASLAQAKASVVSAEARVSQLRHVGAIVANEGLAQAQSNLDLAEADYARAQKLVTAGGMPEVELENAHRTLDLARAQKIASQAQQVAAAPAGADSRVALGALMQAEAQRSAAEVRLAQTRVLATNPSTVLARMVEPGDVVQPGRNLLTLAVDGDVLLSFQADERNLASLALGQKALASADAFPNETFPAEVAYLAPSIDPQRGTVEVRLRVPSPPGYLRPDMTVSVDLLLARKPGALVVASEAVRGAATPTPWVLAVVDGKAARKSVHLGITGEGSTEIVDGLGEGDELVVPSGAEVPVGRRLRTTRKEP